MGEKELINERLRKLQEIKNLGVNPYPYAYDVINSAKELHEKFSSLKNEEHTSEEVSVAGRVMALRVMGKAAFGNIEDLSGKLQFYIRNDTVGEEKYKLFKLLDMGDIIGINGIIFKTKTGELSVEVKDLQLLTKSLRPMPEKWHGLKDPELRYRQRYVDLFMNKEVRDTFVLRSKIISSMRNFLDQKGFLEVEIPVLQPVYGGANARPFITFHNELKMQLFLSISPELYLKRLIVGGMEKVYTICKNFRNEGMDKDHNPEFTMMECYEAYADYNDVMKFTEEMVAYICNEVLGSTKVKFEDKIIDFTPPWKRISMIDALSEYGKLNVEELSDDELKEKIRELRIESGALRGEMINALFEELCEKHLVQPTFITDHPVEISPLTKIHRKNPLLVERFEAFVNCAELCNAYSELNDPEEQNKRLKAQEEARNKGDEEANPMDSDFVRALEYGMHPTGGLGIGVDRLVKLLTGQHSIRDVILFPTMKPEEQ